MKPFLLILVSLCSTLTSFGQQDSGFTDKKEAKNLYKDSLKEGKWMEYVAYFEGNELVLPNIPNTTLPYYIRLGIYNKNNLNGLVREFYPTGQLYSSIFYSNGKKNGVKKIYFTSGKLMSITPFTNDMVNGVTKRYYENGTLQAYIPMTNSKKMEFIKNIILMVIYYLNDHIQMT